MQFLKTVFWVLVAVLIALFARANWTTVTLNLWSDIQAETKLPMLVFVGFLIGWLPTWLIMRARMWRLQRRLEAIERSRPVPVSTALPADEPETVA